MPTDTDTPLISDATARRVAAERLAADGAAGAFQRTGAIQLPTLLEAIDDALAAEPAQHELRLLRRYVVAKGARGPVTGW